MEARQAGYTKLMGAAVATGAVPANPASCQWPPGARRGQGHLLLEEKHLFSEWAVAQGPGWELWGGHR